MAAEEWEAFDGFVFDGSFYGVFPDGLTDFGRLFGQELTLLLMFFLRGFDLVLELLDLL